MSHYQAPSETQIQTSFTKATERYAAVGVDAQVAIDQALKIPIALHCWQGDDVHGFEVRTEAVEGGGIMATGDFPGRARNAEELRQDLEQVNSLLPGIHRLSLHASYAETQGQAIDRDELEPHHLSTWIDWVKQQGLGLDFNSTFFAHPLANDGFTLSHADPAIRDFWIRHGIASRRIAEEISRKLEQPCVNNHWIPDGAKDSPADRWAPRQRLIESLDKMLAGDLGIDTQRCIDSVEGKLFGLGSEDYVVGSYDFYNCYALSRNVVLCLDMGHFHPTEGIHDKLSALLGFHKRLLIHASRPLRWDSDHVVIFNDDLRQVFLELARQGAWDRVFLGLDFFDAAINRIGAYVIGARAARKAILYSLLDPTGLLQTLEKEGKGAQKLAIMEEMKTMPFSAVWDMLCTQAQVLPGASWIEQMETYERQVLAQRG